MKQALIITTYRAFPGGVERANQLLEKCLNELDYEVNYLTADAPYTFTERMFKSLFSYAGVTFLRWRKLKNNSKKLDIVFANGEHALGIGHHFLLNIFHGSYLGMRKGKKISEKSFWTLSYLALIQYVAAKNKKVLSVSSFLSGTLTKQKIQVFKEIPFPVDTDIFYPQGNHFQYKYLFVGSGHYYNKGFDYLEQMADLGHDVLCISDKIYSDKLKFQLNVSSYEMPNIYRNSRFFIFPSRFESLGLAVLEAMASGKPVIMFDVGVGAHLKKIIPEFVIDLTADRTGKDFIDRILLIEKNYDYYSKKARQFVLENYSYSLFKKMMTSIIKELDYA